MTLARDSSKTYVGSGFKLADIDLLQNVLGFFAVGQDT